VQILKCEKLYHGEIGVINRTFGAARRTRVVDRQVGASFLSRPMTFGTSIDADRRKTGEKSAAKPRQRVRLSCAGCAFVGRIATAPIDRARSASTLPNPFSGGDEPM